MSGHGAPWAEEQQMSNSKNISIHNGPKRYQSRFVVQTEIIWKSLMSYIIFSVVEQLVTVPKNKSMMLSGARQSSSQVVVSLMSMRCETRFMTICDDENHRDENLMLPQPEVPRTQFFWQQWPSNSPQMSCHIAELKHGMQHFWTLSPRVVVSVSSRYRHSNVSVLRL